MKFYDFIPKKIVVNTSLLTLCLYFLSSNFAYAQLSFSESFFFGNNFARTKDADIADINADGFPDIFDANSNNRSRNTNPVIRFNNSGNFLSAEIVTDNSNVVTYDADFVDLNQDGYPDLIRTESSPARVSVYQNLKGNGPGAGRQWFDLSNPTKIANVGECPDDIAVGDLNNDGWLDFVVGLRNRGCANGPSGVSVFINQSSPANIPNGGIQFRLVQTLPIRNPNQSIHDVVLIDTNGDGRLDILALNESGNNELYSALNLGSHALTGAVGDFNYEPIRNIFDGSYTNPDDAAGLVLADNINRTVNFYRQNTSPLNGRNQLLSTPFQTVPVPEFSPIYDIELGDFDLDGLTDVLISGFSNSVPASLILVQRPVANPRLNQQRSQFVRMPSTSFPNQPISQFLSGDALDYDLDGDLDIYIAGGDGGGACSGCVRNRFYLNNLPENTSYINLENGLRSWTQGQSVNGETDSHDWRIQKGRTPSFSTGPARAKSGDSYLYLETSGGNAFSQGDNAFLNSPVVAIDRENYNHTLTFDYHMYGDTIGSLHVDVLSPEGREDKLDVFVLEGEQQVNENDVWKTASVNLKNHLRPIGGIGGTSFQIRIRAVAAGSWRGDIALDNIMITNANSD